MDVIITHHNADLDALACLVAARKLYPEALLLQGRALSQAVRRYMALHKDYFPLVPYGDIVPEHVERLIVVDVRDSRRLAEYAPIIESEPYTIVYDHHPAGSHDLVADEAIIEPVGACTTLLCERIREQDVAIEPAEATLLMLGLYADTGQLTYSSTRPRDIDIAAWLLRQGANLRMVTRYLQQQFTDAQRELLLQLMSTTEEMSIDAVEIAIGTAAADRFVKSSASVVDRVMQLGGHDAIFGVLHFVRDKRVQVIGRSRVGYVNIGHLLSELGGGGHAGAGAATFKKREPEEVVAQLRELLSARSFAPTRVGDVMSTPVDTVPHDATLGEVKRLMERNAISGLPVMRDGELAGVISKRDLQRALKREDDFSVPVAARMTHAIVTIAPEEPLEDALRMMTERDIGRMPVLEEGRLVGIITRTDLIRRFYRQHNVIQPAPDDF